MPEPPVPPRGGSRLFEPTDIASLACFRMAFGLAMLCEVWRFFQNQWIDSLAFPDRFHFTYAGFRWVRPWPGVGLYAHFLALGVLAACVAIGVYYRAAIVLLALGWTYVFLLEKANYLNHLYLICLLSGLMACVPAARAYSFDSRRNPAGRSDWMPAWCLWLLRGQLAIPYFYGGLAKLNGDWLQGQPLRMWMSRMTHLHGVIPGWGDAWLALAFSYGGLVLDLCVVPLLLWRRTRRWAFAAAVLFHLANALMFTIGIFPWLMIAATTLFLDPSWPRRLLRWAPPQSPPRLPRAAPPHRERRIVVLLAVWFAVQLLVPLRHWLYPGNVDWTGEGQRFAWRMMLSDKWSALRFVVTDPATGRRGPLDPRPYLDERQFEKMSEDPEMILEFCRFLGREIEQAGYSRREIRAVVLCSLNGRKPQLLIDPTVDLTTVRRSFGRQPWIVPLHEPLRAEPWTVPPSEWEKYVDVTPPGRAAP